MFRAERKLHVLHGDIAFLFELYTSTSGDLEGGGPRTCTLSTMGTVQLAFSGSLAQPPKCPTDRINKTRTPIASSLLFLNWLQKKIIWTRFLKKKDRDHGSANTVAGCVHKKSSDTRTWPWEGHKHKQSSTTEWNRQVHRRPP